MIKEILLELRKYEVNKIENFENEELIDECIYYVNEKNLDYIKENLKDILMRLLIIIKIIKDKLY